MKLLKLTACRLAVSGGNVCKAAVMGDAIMEESSDRGSIPLSSIACGKEEPTEWEDALSLGRNGLNIVFKLFLGQSTIRMIKRFL